MRDYYIFNSGRLQRKENTINFETDEGVKKSLPILDVNSLHIFGEVDLNTKFINLISKEGIIMHIYNYYGFYSGTFYPRKKNVSGYLTVKQSAHYLNSRKRLFLAQNFVDASAHQMLRNLKKYKNTESFISNIEKERSLIYLTTDIHKLMGVEGNIRKIYYSAFNTMLKNGFELNSRIKRPTTDPVNALISFGNSVMYTTVLGEIYKTQLDPAISYLHEPSSKRFSLSLDIAEIFKPLIIDSIILKMINTKMITEKHFSYENGVCFLNEEGKKKFLEEYNKKLETTIKHRALKRNVSYRYLIRLECYKLIKHVIDDDIYKPLKSWW